MHATLSFFAWFGGAEVSGAGTWWTIVSGLSTFIVTQFAWIRKIQGELNACKDRQIASLEEKLKLTRDAKDPSQP